MFDRFLMRKVAPIVQRRVTIDTMQSYPELGIRSFGNGTFHKPALSGAEAGTKKLYRVESGDLLFSNVFAWEGAIAIVKPEDKGRYGSHRFMSCLPLEGIATQEFLCFPFLTPEGMRQIGEAPPGGAGRNRALGMKKLEAIEVPIPSYDKQVWFSELVRKVNLVRQQHKESEKELDRLMPSILDKAFNGEL